MKKTTKRLTMVVAILLSLVLLTSSVVSTTLAKFVIRKESNTTVTLNKFGVEVTFSENGSSVTKKGDSIIYTNNLTMSPGDSKTITAKIKGKPNVAAIITVDVDITATDLSKFKIAKNTDFTSIKSADKYYFPIGFKTGANPTSYDVNPYGDASKLADTASNIEGILTGKLSGLAFSGDDGKTAEWSTSTTVTETDISLKFDWPEDYNTTCGENSPIYDEIGTYLSKNNPGFTITYIITVEQDPSK